MDYQAEIEANNARIAELKGRLAQIQGQGAIGTNDMDYRLAAQRAQHGDTAGARYHLGVPEQRNSAERMREIYGASSASDLEYQYAKLRDAVLSAEDELNYVPKGNTGAAKTAQRRLKNAQENLRIFERKNPNVVKMHWNWAGQAQERDREEDAPAYTVQGVKARIGDLLITGKDGKVYLKEGADVNPVIDDFKKIPYWWEDEDVRNQIRYLSELQTVPQSVGDNTVANLQVFKLDPAKFSGGLWVDEAARNEAKTRFDALAPEQKNSKEAMELKAALNKWTKAEYSAWKKAMQEEGRRRFEGLPRAEYDLANAKSEFTSDGRKWTRKDGKWETDSTWRK